MLTASLEKILNRGLSRSPRARELCSELAGMRLALEVREVGCILMRSSGNALHLSRMDDAASVEVRISGTPLSLLRLARSAAPLPLPSAATLIDGDTEVAAKYRELLRLLLPEPEEELSRLIGDVPAHQFARFARATFCWGRDSVATVVRNVAEYLQHERADLVARAEADQLCNGIEQVREDLDRLEARIRQLSS